jgi:hypothetical protein
MLTCRIEGASPPYAYALICISQAMLAIDN